MPAPCAADAVRMPGLRTRDHVAHARACLPARICACGRRASRLTQRIATLLVGLFALGAVLCGLAAAPAVAAGGPESQLVALQRQERQLRRDVSSLQTQLLYSQQAYEQVESDRDRALELLTRHVLEVYKQGRTDAVAMLLAARSIDDALERGRMVHVLTEYEQGLLADLDAAEERGRIGQHQTGELITEVLDTQRRLGEVQMRLDEHAERRAARRAKAGRVPIPAKDGGTLVADGGPGPIDPDLVFGASFGNGSPEFGGFTGGGFIGGGGVPAGASASAIDAYLAAKGSPMAGSGVFFMASGQRAGIDPRLVVAIAGAESNFGQITCGPFNAWGWSCPNAPVAFGSWAEGIEEVTSSLRRFYVDEGRTTVIAIQQKYAPSGAANDPTGLNNHWVANVSKFLVELGGNPNRIAAPSTITTPVQ